MTAYMVFTREKTVDPGEMKLYAEQAAGANGDFPLTPLALYGKLDVLEGAPFEGSVILSFPSREEARAWYESPAYQAAREHRLKGAEYRVFLIDGIDTPAPK